MKLTSFPWIKAALLNIFLVGMIFFYSCGPGLKKGETVSALERTIKSADGTEIVYEVNGIVKDTALVFIHGWSADRSYWRNQIPYFSKDYMMVTVDLGGHGESGLDRKDYTMGYFGDDVVAVIQDLKLKKVVLVAHDMGGGVAFQVALKDPEKVIAIVGVDTYQNIQNISDEAVNTFISAYKKDFTGTLRNHISNLFPPGTDNETIRWIIEDMASAPPSIAISSIDNYLRSNPENFIRRITVPVYSINSAMFRVNVDGNRNLLTVFESYPMQNVGHFPQLEDPATFNLLLREILRSRVLVAN